MKNPRLVIEDMDRLGIGMCVSSSATVIEPTSWAEPAAELELVRRLNDTVAQWEAQFPQRIIGSFVLPLQEMDLALQELTRAVGLGLKVANIGIRQRLPTMRAGNSLRWIILCTW
jgi:aminocarboxymuconate-semialdehyde decarboxylase